MNRELATSIARAVINRAAKHGRAQAVFAHEDWWIIRCVESPRYKIDCFRFPNYLIGIYTHANLEDIVADLMP